MSIGRLPSSMISTTGHPHWQSSARVCGAWRRPATMIPAGDQPSMVETSSVSRARSYWVLPSRSWWPAASSSCWMPWITSMNTALDSDGTITGTTRLRADASMPAARFGT